MLRLAAGEEVVDAQHVVPGLEQALAEVRAEEAGAAGDATFAHGAYACLNESLPLRAVLDPGDTLVLLVLLPVVDIPVHQPQNRLPWIPSGIDMAAVCAMVERRVLGIELDPVRLATAYGAVGNGDREPRELVQQADQKLCLHG
jgi:hypothetical protein